MAYVGITEKLIGDVRNRINDMEAQELQAFVPGWPKFLINPRNPEVMQALWGEHLYLESQIPDKWKDSGTYVTFKFPDLTVRVEATKDSFRGPCNCTRYDTEYKKSHTDDPELLALCEHRRKANEIQAKWREVGAKVVNFVKAAKSLNEAIKLWPQVALYIPQKYLDMVALKHAKKQAGSAAADLLSEMETDQLTAHAVAARMIK